MARPLFEELPEEANVLFIRLRNLGESVLDTANLRALKRFRPDLRITTLVEPIYADLYAADPDIRVMSVQRSWQARLKALRSIRGARFAAVINLHGGPSSAQLTVLSGARHRVGGSQFRDRYVYNLLIPPAEDVLGRQALHTVEYQFGQFRWLGLPGSEPDPTSLHVAPQFRNSASEHLRRAGIDPERAYAVLAPTNEFYTKRWPPERYGQLAEALAARGFQVVMTGASTPEQRAQLAAVRAATRIELPSLSTMTIGELVAVIAGARLFVGNDSGPAHIAAAVKTPLAVLFGPADSVRWRPWQAPSALVQNHFPCNPCSMYTCKAFDQPECMRSITVNQVMKAIDRLV